ncbi:MAG TPA: HEAT repeat domain-containing protein, partial [Gemmatimonadaceae bacterium]|nr:HEAT repeat domain-containing protein [Gemmatimonadaceae bacterium]
LFDLVKLLATPPTQPDPLAFFAARAAAVDARAIPRTLRAAEVVEAPSVEEPVSVKEPASVKERASARVTRPSGSQAVVVEAPSQETPDKRSDRLTESLPIPETDDAELAALFATLQQTDPVEHLRDPLERLVTRADLAFRAGDSATMLVAMAGLVAIEHLHLERDASDERRREFARAVRKLATPPILRQLATLRHKRADDAATIQRVQAILHRYGTDGAEALIDEWANAPSAAARAICVEALRALRRTHDALFDLVRHTDDQRVRQGIALLGALGDARAEQLVLEQLRHPDARTRREVMAALERFPSAGALDALGVGLLDDEPTVRLRAIAAVTPRGALAVKLLAPLLDTEPDREVLYAAIAALGSVGGAEPVQVLIRAVNGETQHAKRRSAAYRLQACAALAQIRTPQAMAAVQSLRDDRDRELREGAMRLVAQAARRGTTAQRALTDA